MSKQLYYSGRDHLDPRHFPHDRDDVTKVEWGPKGRQLTMQAVLRGSRDAVATALWEMNRATTNSRVNPMVKSYTTEVSGRDYHIRMMPTVTNFRSCTT